VSLVRDLVLLHLGATAVLLVVFTAVVACQGGAGLLRARAGRRAPAPVPTRQAAATSVRDWTIDLREPVAVDAGPLLSKTS